ncbi:MAG: hypothetical protein ACJAVV_003909 [Alphaproteobacteria bacterium]|jgi:hypothetical protein
MLKDNDIPQRRFDIDLTSMQPTEITPDLLRPQLESIGLTCEETSTANLEVYIQEVREQLAAEGLEAYGIFQRQGGIKVSSAHDDYRIANLCAVSGKTLDSEFELSANGAWTPDSTAQGYDVELFTVINEKHFSELEARKFPTFTGARGVPVIDHTTESGADAIKGLFLKVAISASSALPEDGGLDRDTTTAALSNAIGVEGPTQVDYTKLEDRVILLVKDYDPRSKNAAGVGALNVHWNMVITDVGDKKNKKHKSVVTSQARVALYSSIDNLMADYTYLKEL